MDDAIYLGENTMNNSDDRTREVVWLIRKLMRGGELYTKELNKEYQVSSPQLSCLLALFEHGPLPPSQIAKQIMVNSSTVTGIIDRLEQKGFVERSRVSPDRRVITISLTEKGKTLAEHAPPPLQKKIVEGLGKLPTREVDEIIKALGKLAYMMDVHDLDVE
jgi:DNA-binding MarR family transcriptional regulator